MKSEKQDVGQSAYEAPRIVDYGDLVELTAGGAHCVHPASIRKPGCQPPKFS